MRVRRGYYFGGGDMNKRWGEVWFAIVIKCKNRTFQDKFMQIEQDETVKLNSWNCLEQGSFFIP